MPGNIASIADLRPPPPFDDRFTQVYDAWMAGRNAAGEVGQAAVAEWTQRWKKDIRELAADVATVREALRDRDAELERVKAERDGLQERNQKLAVALDQKNREIGPELEALKERVEKLAGWKKREEHPKLFYDGDQYLVALQVGQGVGTYHWEYYVVRVRCDEDYFDVTLDGDSWGWSWEDVEFYIPLSEFRLSPLAAMSPDKAAGNPA